MMADPIDQGDAARELLLDLAIAAARRPAQAAPALEGGQCANACGEDAMPGSRFCCASCRDETERRERIRNRQGLR